MLITRDVPRVGMVGLTAGTTKERDLSWLDWSAPKDLSLDGKQLLFTESGEAGGETIPPTSEAPTDPPPFASATA